MLPILVAAAVATASAPATDSSADLLTGARHAISVGRVAQAKLMISRAMVAGAAGPKLDRTLADLAFVTGNYAEAYQRYDALLRSNTTDAEVVERAGIAALRLNQLDRAVALLDEAIRAPRASWRAWNARGVAADWQGDWRDADSCYDHAIRVAPAEAAPLTNRGWSLMLRGNWRQAGSYFQLALRLDPSSARTKNNLELAMAAEANVLPRRMQGETDEAWAARLNDAGMAAAILGDKRRASAAFTQAMDVRGTWYARAANNLEALGHQ